MYNSLRLVVMRYLIYLVQTDRYNLNACSGRNMRVPCDLTVTVCMCQSMLDLCIGTPSIFRGLFGVRETLRCNS